MLLASVPASMTEGLESRLLQILIVGRCIQPKLHFTPDSNPTFGNEQWERCFDFELYRK